MRNSPIKNTLPMALMVVMALTVLLCGGPLGAEETLIKIHQDDNLQYFKPEVEIAPNNDIYIAYRAQVRGGGRSEIYLSKYSADGTVSFVKNLSESTSLSYEPEIVIQSNGYIHATWADQDGDTHVVKYRYFNGSSWSNITAMGQVDNSENIEDLRIAVDQSGNVFVVFMFWPAGRCRFISKYGNNISFENFPESGRSKHPDVAVDANHVHIVWQYKPDDAYTIGYQRRPNSRGSQWEKWVNLNFTGTQRPRMSLDNGNNPHVVFFRNFGSTRILWYKEGQGKVFGDAMRMSDPNNAETYHFCDVSAVNADNVIVTMQRGGWSGGKNVSYNWKKNGKWSGFSFFAASYGYRPTKQSVALARDRHLAAVAFCRKDDTVFLLLADEGGGNPDSKAPTAQFTFSPQGGHAPLDVTFDASTSSDPDGTITHYSWVFGDGTGGSGQTPSHRYEAQGTYTATLTVTDNDGKTGSVSHPVIVDPPNQAPTAHFTFSPVSGLYPLTVTFDARASSDPDGQVTQYEWDFGGEQNASGAVVSHTFLEEGLQDIVLTVYDNDGDSATASGTVEVLGLLPPLGISYEPMENRNLFTIEHVYKVTWGPNPGNPARGADIVQYNIYRRAPGQSVYTYAGTVSASVGLEYYDRVGTVKQTFHYTVTAVDSLGRESDLPGASPAPRIGPVAR